MSISVRPSRHSHRLIQESGDFVVNIPSRDMAKAVDMCGGCSGRDIDKFQALSFTKMPASKVSSPMIGECPINIECRVRQILRLGSHDMFIGEIVAAHVDKAIVDNDGNIDYHKAAPLIYNHGQYWDLGAEIGHYGFSKE
jgi:flavin reductase (DIM6/NTAB) family NADH-FMN oxidoreductase RutF